MERKKVLIAVTTYPLPSRSYDEVVCTAGLLEDGSWIRIYPVPLSFLINLKEGGKVNNRKYSWIELDLKKRPDDFRPESHSPIHYDFRDLEVHGTLDTSRYWGERKKFCLSDVYTNLSKLIKESQHPTNKSLATFKPAVISKFVWEPEEEREWKSAWQALRDQGDLFTNPEEIKKMIPKVPYKFFYVFKDDQGRESKLMIEDWEIGQLYWNCLRIAKGDESVALQKVKQKYFEDLAKTKDIHLFLGTTKEWHTRRSKNPFVIIGVFYPPFQIQGTLF